MPEDQMLKVTAVHGSREWEGKHGKKVSYTVEVAELEGRHELTQLPTTPAPKVGDELWGHDEDGGAFPSGDPKPRKIVKGNRQQSGGSGAPRPEDPKRARRIMRQHSQEMALRYAAIRQLQGKLPDTFSLADLDKIADHFDRDAEAAA